MTRTPIATLLALALALSTSHHSLAADVSKKGQAKTGKSGLPVPRFVSLRSDKVNLRQGPSRDYPVKWLFKRINLPVEIIAEYEHWRKVRDSQGSEGWVFYRLLTGRRTALVMPWEKEKRVLQLQDKASANGQLVAKIESGAMVTINECNGKWCSVEASKINGWIPQGKLWGVYAGEIIKK